MRTRSASTRDRGGDIGQRYRQRVVDERARPAAHMTSSTRRLPDPSTKEGW